MSTLTDSRLKDSIPILSFLALHFTKRQQKLFLIRKPLLENAESTPCLTMSSYCIIFRLHLFSRVDGSIFFRSSKFQIRDSNLLPNDVD